MSLHNTKNRKVLSLSTKKLTFLADPVHPFMQPRLCKNLQKSESYEWNYWNSLLRPKWKKSQREADRVTSRLIESEREIHAYSSCYLTTIPLQLVCFFCILKWTSKFRPLAIGIGNCGSAMGSMALPPLYEWIAEVKKSRGAPHSSRQREQNMVEVSSAFPSTRFCKSWEEDLHYLVL